MIVPLWCRRIQRLISCLVHSSDSTAVISRNEFTQGTHFCTFRNKNTFQTRVLVSYHIDMSTVCAVYLAALAPIPPLKLLTVGSRAFFAAASRIWNGPPDDVVAAQTLSSLRWMLKTFVFRPSALSDIIPQSSKFSLVLWYFSEPCDNVCCTSINQSILYWKNRQHAVKAV